MNDHAGWTPDLKCVLCGSDDPGEPCTGLPKESEKSGIHKCAGVVPGTFIICGEDDYQYCSEACLEIAKRSKELK